MKDPKWMKMRKKSPRQNFAMKDPKLMKTKKNPRQTQL